MLYIIHQKIEKDNDKLFYFQHNLSDFGAFSKKVKVEPTIRGDWHLVARSPGLRLSSARP